MNPFGSRPAPSSTPRATTRTTRGWIGATTAALVVVAGSAAGCASRSASSASTGAQAGSSGSAASASSAPSVPSAPSLPSAASSASTPSPTGSTSPAGSSPANDDQSSGSDPHQAAAQQEADRIITTFQAPPGATEENRRPDPVPSGLGGPPIRSGARTVATAVAWYTTSQTPDEVLAWVQTHRPTGSSPSGSGSGSVGPSFVTFAYPTPDSSLIVTPASGPDGRTVIRLDASVIWTPSRNPDTRLGYTASSVTVVTVNSLNPHNSLPARETAPLTATAPLVVHQVVDLLNALQPRIPASRNCAMDDGTLVRITLPGLATVTANPGGCGEVTVTPANGAAQTYAGGPDLITRVYALFGVTWSRTGDLPPGTERTGASGLQ